MTPDHHDDRVARLKAAIARKREANARHGSTLPHRAADVTPRLGGMQRSLWLAHQLHTESPAYNLASAFRWEGPIDRRRLAASVTAVVSRHRVLRSTYRVRLADVEQVIHPPAPVPADLVLAEFGRQQEAAVGVARQPFDLERGPLIRMAVVEAPDTTAPLVLLVVHHIVADERSLGLLWQEIAATYDGDSSREAPVSQYDDFVAWAASEATMTREEDLAFWRSRLNPPPADLALPGDLRDSRARGPRGRLLQRALNGGVAQTVRKVAARAGVTPFMILAFAFALLLRRYGQHATTTFATPVSTRSHPATADMIGYFLNPVVLGIGIDEDQLISQGLDTFCREVRERLAHAATPFDVLAQMFAPTRRRDRHPLFQTMFVLQEPLPSPQLRGVTLEPMTLDLGESKFELSLFVAVGENDTLTVSVEYQTARFAETSMVGLIDHYTTLLHHLSVDPGRRIAEVELVPSHERERLTHDWQGGPAADVGGAAIPQRILDQARRTPEAEAVVCGQTRWSYGRLEQSAWTIARALASGGVQPGDRVALFFHRSVSLITAVIGSHWAEAAYVPVDPSYPATRNAAQLQDADVAVVLTSAAVKDQVPDGPWSVVEVDQLNSVEAPTAAFRPPADDVPAYLLYTSGSTGRPKGVVVSHGNLRTSTAARFNVYDTPPSRFLLLPSIAFDSSVAGLFWTLASGGTLVIPTEREIRDPERLVELMLKMRVSTVLCVPSLYRQLLRIGGQRLSDLDTAIVAGETCPPPVVRAHFRAIPQTRLFNEYGPTEATVWATVHEVTPTDTSDPVPIGQPIPGVRVDVLDPHGRLVPIGLPGEAWIEGPTVAQGYWRAAQATRERFVPAAESPGGARRYRTGDRVRWTANGRLQFLGRVDHQIKIRGHRIEPGEIETALRGLPDVDDAAVVVRPTGTRAVEGEDVLVAFLQTAHPRPGADRRRQLAERLPSVMVPALYVERTALPRLPNGKIDRSQLATTALAPAPALNADQHPASDRERALVRLWEGLLERSPVGVTDNFFELGGHSLLVVEMVQSIEQDEGIRLSTADVFAHPTVRELAQLIDHERPPQGAGYDHLFPIQPGGRKRPLVVAIPHFFTNMLAERFRGERPVYGLRGVSLRPEGNTGRWPTMADLAEELADEVARRFPEEDVLLAGYSFGATMAVETARLLETRGTRVDRLYLIAPMALDVYPFGPFRIQIGGLREPVSEVARNAALRRLLRDNHPFTRRFYTRLWQWSGVQPWRRLLCQVGRLRRQLGLSLTPGIMYADVRIERFRLHRQYEPQPIETPTIIFNAIDPDEDAAATWRPYFVGPLSVYRTPDPHRGGRALQEAQTVILQHLESLAD